MTLRERLAKFLAPTSVVSRDELTTLLAEKDKVAAERVREALSFGLQRADDAQNMANGFRAITQGGIRTRPEIQLQPLAQDHMLRLVTFLRDSNPLAGWLLNTTVDFTLGEGFTVDSEDDDVKECITEFVDDPVNQLDLRFDRFAMEFGMYGELCLPVFTNSIDGHSRLGYIDPYTIHYVATDPNNVLIRTAVVLKAPASQPQKPIVLKVIREETWRSSPNYGLMMAAEPGEIDATTGRPYDGSCFLFQTNHVSNATRGRSDLLPLIDWLDGYDQFLFDAMDTANLFNSFVYDLKLEGGTEDQIKEQLIKLKGLKKGQVYGHNEKVALQAVAPDLKANDKQVFAQDLRGHILGAMSFPEHWYGLGGEVNLATAKEMGLPPVKRLTHRQKELKYILGQLFKYELHQKVRVGDLPREVVIGKVDRAGSSTGVTVPIEQSFKVVLPELSMRDRAGIVAAVVSLTSALIQAKTEGWIRPETAAKLFAAQVSELGLGVDASAEFDPNVVPPMPAASQDYSPQNLQRILAQLQRQGNGNGDNIGQPKQTTPVGGRVGENALRDEVLMALMREAMHPQREQPIHVTTGDTHVRTPDITVNNPVTVEPAAVTVNQAPVTVEPAQVTVESPTVNISPAPISVESPAVTVEAPVVNVTVPEHKQVATRDTVTERDDQGRVVTVERTPMEPPNG